MNDKSGGNDSEPDPPESNCNCTVTSEHGTITRKPSGNCPVHGAN